MIKLFKPPTRPGHKHRQTSRDPTLQGCFSAQVEDLTSGGYGVIAHPSGVRFFIGGVWPGERVTVEIETVKSRSGTARLVAVDQPSPDRVAPPCKFQGAGSGQCGGCAWMFIDYPAQLHAKQKQVLKALDGLVARDLIRQIIPAPQPLGYRNRAQLKTDGERLGFLQAGSHTLIEVDDCLALSDTNRATLRDLCGRLPDPAWRPHKKHQWTTLDIDESVSAVSASVNQRLPFQQANDAQNERMQEWVAEILAPVPRRAPILELFAGSGNFTRVAVEMGYDHITAVEGVATAVQALLDLQLPGVAAEVADLFNALSVSRLSRTWSNTNVLLLDPPRDGFRLIEALLPDLPKLTHIIYISCDLATFRRDAGYIIASGFAAREVQPLDLFPQTPHIETMTFFERQTP